MNKRNTSHKGNFPELLGIEVRGKKGVQMVLNKLIKERFDHETVLLILSDLLVIKKWDDTNFISFETLILQKARTIRSRETRLSYTLLWRKYQEKKSKHKLDSAITGFGEDIKSLLEARAEFSSGNGGPCPGAGTFSIGK